MGKTALIKVKEEYSLKKGIQSFSSYITYILFKLIDEDTKKNAVNTNQEEK